MPRPKACRCWCSINARFGGQAGASARIENYLGFPTGISGGALAGRAFSQALKFGAEVAIPLQVAHLDCGGPARRPHEPLRLELTDGRSVSAAPSWSPQARAIASRTFRMSTDFEGAGVSYWASAVEAKLCEGEEIALVGGGNSAGQAVVFLAPKVKHMHLVVRGKGLEATMSRYLIDRIAALPNVPLYTGAEVIALEGDRDRRALQARRSAASTPETSMPIRCGTCSCSSAPIRTATGSPSASRWTPKASSSPARDFAPTDVPIDRAPLPLETSVAGVFAIGDVRAGSTKRVGAAIGEGAAVVAQIHAALAQLTSGQATFRSDRT